MTATTEFLEALEAEIDRDCFGSSMVYFENRNNNIEVTVYLLVPINGKIQRSRVDAELTPADIEAGIRICRALVMEAVYSAYYETISELYTRDEEFRNVFRKWTPDAAREADKSARLSMWSYRYNEEWYGLNND